MKAPGEFWAVRRVTGVRWICWRTADAPGAVYVMPAISLAGPACYRIGHHRTDAAFAAEFVREAQ